MKSGNFNPRSPCRERRSGRTAGCHTAYFNPRSPCGERPRCPRRCRAKARFQSTLPVRGATFGVVRHSVQVLLFQSTLPVRGTTAVGRYLDQLRRISIHAPRAGSDNQAFAEIIKGIAFQSTLPVRGATSCHPHSSSHSAYFNPRSPCGERLMESGEKQRVIIFQSTLPVRGATRVHQRPSVGYEISIHAPRAGSDNSYSRARVFK